MCGPIIKPAAQSLTFKWVRLLYLPDVAVSQRIEDLIHHAVIHILQRRWHPGDIQLALLTRAAHRYISRRVQKNCTQTELHSG